MESPRSTAGPPVAGAPVVRPGPGARIRAVRAAADLSREELARRIGTSARSIRRLEDEQRRTTPEELRRIALASGAPEWFLLHGWGGWERPAAAAHATGGPGRTAEHEDAVPPPG